MQGGRVNALAIGPVNVAAGTPSVTTQAVAGTEFVKVFGFVISSGIPSGALSMSYLVAVGANVVFSGSFHATTASPNSGISIQLPGGRWFQGLPDEDLTVTLTTDTAASTLNNVRCVTYYRLEKIVKGN